MLATERPALNFDMFRTNRDGIRMVTDEVQKDFGVENYDIFRRAGKRGEYIPEEVRQRVDREIYDKVARVFEVRKYSGERLWHEAMVLANMSVNYAHRILFPDQDKRGTMTTNIAWSTNRPSTALEVLTTPTRLMGAQYKYEQGRQLGFALIGAEVISEDENGEARDILTKLNNFLEERFFKGKKGDPKPYPVFSYHTPFTNRLVGLSDGDQDPKFAEGLWVKQLEFPVRKLSVRNADGEMIEVPVLYDPRDKDKEAAVIKAKQRSFKTALAKANGGLIETSPYMEDKLGFRLVLMEGGRPLRDKVTADLEELFKEFEGFEGMIEDNEPNKEQGDPDRVKFQRRKIKIKGLKRPIEMMVYSLEDWIKQEYEVGGFDADKGMHDGHAHDLYKLEMVTDIAEYSWPFRIYGIDLRQAKKEASYDYADRLGRKQRIYPPIYPAAA